MKKLVRPTLFTLGGICAGLVYYRFFGCTTGCPITSSPWLTALYTGFIGWLFSGILSPKQKTK